MRPQELKHACGCCIARSFPKKVRHLNITESEDRASLVEFMIAYGGHYQAVLTPRGLEHQLYKTLISCLRSRANTPVFLAAMLAFCSKVTIDQIAMLAQHREASLRGSGLALSKTECWGTLHVLVEYYHQQQSQSKEDTTKPFALPTTCLVLEGIHFDEPDFLVCLLSKMPNLRHISLQQVGSIEIMKTLSSHCKLLESLCFLEMCTEPTILEQDIFEILFGVAPPTDCLGSGSLFEKFVNDNHFRESLKFQFPKLKKLDIDDLFLDEDAIHDMYVLALLLQPNLVCFGKDTGIMKRTVTNYKKVWSAMFNRPESEATLQLAEARFVATPTVRPGRGALELPFWEAAAPMFENVASVELQIPHWNEDEVAKFCHLFKKQARTFSLCTLPLSDMSCLSNVTHLRLTPTLGSHYSFDKMHLILDSCPSLKTLSIHPTFYHEGAPRGDNRLQDPPHFFGHMIDNEDLDIIERVMLAEVLGEAMALHLEGIGIGLDPDEDRFLGIPPPPPEAGQEAVPAVRAPSSRGSKKGLAKHHNLTTLRISSVCQASRQQSEDFLREVLERLPNLRHLCLGVWMASLSQRLTCTGDALTTVLTDDTLKEPLLPHLTQLCCLPSGTGRAMCQSLAALVEALPSLHTLVLPHCCMLGPTLRYFQHSSLDIQYKCATDQVFSYWEPEH